MLFIDDDALLWPARLEPLIDWAQDIGCGFVGPIYCVGGLHADRVDWIVAALG
jgi:hypothetical protein